MTLISLFARGTQMVRQDHRQKHGSVFATMGLSQRAGGLVGTKPALGGSSALSFGQEVQGGLNRLLRAEE